jgi:IMP cyclohydrolase
MEQQQKVANMGEANHNLVALSNNVYPGRGLVAGLDETGRQLVQIYFLMGRSANSRNRILGTDHKTWIRTEPIKAIQRRNKNLVIYQAMGCVGPVHVASNGEQTCSVLGHYKAGHNKEQIYPALLACEYEPDPPNFTARITAVSITSDASVIMAITRKPESGAGSYHEFYKYEELCPGFGYYLTTYAGDGDPLPTFVGDPYALPLVGKIDDIAKTYWGILNEENRVALAVKFINIHNGQSKIMVINKYRPVA